MAKNKPTKKGSAGIFAVVVATILVNAILDDNSSTGIIVLFCILAVAVLVFVVANGIKAVKKANDGVEFKGAASRPAANAGCEYGQENCKYSHDDERRLAQLNAFLRDGIIDRKEYTELMRKFRISVETNKLHK